MADSSLIGKYHCMIKLGEYSRPNPMSPADFKTKQYIKLPLPLEMRDDTAVNYNNTDLTSVGDVINGAIGGGLASYALRKSGDLISGGASRLGAAAADTAMPGAGDMIGGGIAEAFPPDQVASAIQQSLGAAPNPNPSVMFTGPSLREFNFSWQFFPRSLSESNAIRNVVNTLKAAALPAASFSSSASVLSYPFMVQMNFYPWDNGGKGPYGWSKNSIIKMKKCMMASVNVNYAPSNVPAFFGGESHPVAISLSIQLKEIEYMMSHDWGGRKPGVSGSEEDFGTKITNTGTGITTAAAPIVTKAGGPPAGNGDNPQDAAPPQ